MKGRFFVIDGLGGTGKTTQLRLLRKRLGEKAVVTHEPGGTKRAEHIRALLKSTTLRNPDALADFFLFWAARAENVNEKIKPALKAGKTVVCDRFDSSTFAMQVRGDKQKGLEKLFWQCREHLLAGCEPDAYIILDAAPRLAHTRRTGRGEKEDRFDDRDAAYQKRVRAGYREFAERIGAKAHILDAGQSPEEIHEKIWGIVESAR